MAQILIIDDDALLCKTLARLGRKMGHSVTTALTLEAGRGEIRRHPFEVVFLDVNLPDGNGLDALPHIRNAPSSPEVIIITGAGDPDGAQIAMEYGAWAYVEKPLSMGNVMLQLSRALQYRREKASKRPAVALKREGIVGDSPGLERCLDLIAQIADSRVSVLLYGETGTGKELFAKAIHRNSSRSDRNFVVVDCAALPETLVGSVLFGHERGAFTGADRSRTGLIKEADGGTLFLDEVGELPLSIQKDFLRVLQENRFRPIGGTREIASDFRLVSATNRNLESMVASGQFRNDLYFRLQSVAIRLPPLRDRVQDIKDLAMHYMVKFCERQGMETKGFSPDFFETLNAYDWPGNVRELAHTMERVLAVARFEPTLFPRHLPTKIRIHQARASISGPRDDRAPPAPADAPCPKILPKLQEVREAAIAKVERQYLNDLMLFSKNSVKEATRISGLSRSRLYSLLQKHQIARP